MRPEPSELAGVVVKALAPAFRTVDAKIEALEQKFDVFAPVPGPQGEPGVPGESIVGPQGPPGQDAPPVSDEQILQALERRPDLFEKAVQFHTAVLDAMVQRHVESFLKANPPAAGKDGQDGTNGVDGQSVTPEQLQPMVAELVTKAVADIPKPTNGQDGKDGIGVAGALIDKDGALVLTLSNGQVKELGPVVGTKGEPGRDGKDGTDGRDGLGFEDLTFDHDEEGRLIAKFVRGEVVKAAQIPCTVDRGIWDPSKSYLKGDGVTLGGSYWIAQKDSANRRPGTAPEWRLSVKKGADGKQGPAGTKGQDGRNGKDWHEVKPDGSKW